MVYFQRKDKMHWHFGQSDRLPTALALEKLNFFHTMEVLFPEYFQSISRIFPYYGKHFNTMELEIGFSNLFLQLIFPLNISILWEAVAYVKIPFWT